MEEAAIVSTLQLQCAAVRAKLVVCLSHETQREEVEVVVENFRIQLHHQQTGEGFQCLPGGQRSGSGIFGFVF